MRSLHSHQSIELAAALAVAWFAAACGSSSPGGYGARCDDVSQCGGETPLCSDGACVECTGAADCRPGDAVCTDQGLCGECGADVDCPATEPFCGDRNKCTECRNNDDCGAAQPVCVPKGKCEPACTADAMCDADKMCHPDLGACVECADDNDCVGRDGVFCDTDRYECVDCRTADDCGAAKPFCLVGHCEQCIQNTDCAAGQRCDDDLECRTSCDSDAQCTDGDRTHCIVDTGVCVECEQDTHCTRDVDKTVCIAQRCEQCRENADCPTDKPICDTTKNECTGG